MGIHEVKSFKAVCDNCDKEFAGLFENQNNLIDELDNEDWIVDGKGNLAEIFCPDCVDEVSDDEVDAEIDEDEDTEE